MSVDDLYSKLNKKTIDVFAYDAFSKKLKIQIVHTWKSFFAKLPEDFTEEVWNRIHALLSEEFGKKTLLEDSYFRSYNDSERVEYYFEEKASLDECLDTIEIVFRDIYKMAEFCQKKGYHISQLPKEAEYAIKNLNTRFIENGVGYSFEQGRIIRLDNKLLHQETIIPVFDFLNSITFKNANDEFLNAHEHFRFKRNKECLADCLKTLETTMKIICHENNWSYNQNDTAKALIDICFKNKLIPDYLQNQFSSLRAVLESGIPTLRNKLGGHGQGMQQIKVPDHFASYMLYLTGTTVYFLISCQREIKPFS